MDEVRECQAGEQMSMLMSLALDGMLEPDDKHQLDRHLEACPSCRLEWKAMQQVSVLLEGEPMVGPPLGFAVRVERRLEEKTKKRRWAFSGLAVLTSSLPLAGLTVGVVTAVVLALVAWNWLGSMPSVQQSTAAIFQVASGLALIGKGASFFLKDLLLRYGAPLVIVLAVGLTVLAGMWTWVFVKRPGSSHRNGYV